MVRENPECVFVFGDNILRTGRKGQAAAMRGEPNAIGVITKRHPSMEPGSFLTDTNKNWHRVLDDLCRIEEALQAGKTVYVPADGIGTGLAKMQEYAPRIFKRMRNFFLHRSPKGMPW